jgi:membrane protein DedA with SNARE-associated domain
MRKFQSPLFLQSLTLLPGTPLATIDIFQILQNVLHILGYPGVALFIMIESEGIPCFYAGHTGGKAFIERYGRYLFLKPEHMKKAEVYFAKYGEKTVFLGRFVAILRAWAAFLAGINKMHWKTFLVYNAAGGILWATIYGLLGYFAGRIFQNDFSKVEHIASIVTWSLGGAIVLGVSIFVVRHYVRQRGQAQKQ